MEHINTVTDIVRFINKADPDEMSIIADAYAKRLKGLKADRARLTRGKLELGVKVRITNGIKPRYMTGAMGVVVNEPEGRFCRVSLGNGPWSRRFGNNVNVPITCLEVIS